MSHAATYAEIKQILKDTKRVTNEVLLRVAKLAIAETLGERLKESEDPMPDIEWDSKLGDDLMLDSLDMVELVMFLEECFGVEIPDEDAGTIVTVGDALEVIKKNKKKAPRKRKKVNKKKKTTPGSPLTQKFTEQVDAASRKSQELDAEIEKALQEDET
tara:strand:- start:6085 stop:6561 length:477 start_codon:yes stop_codon:yes gene_type:complete